MEQWKRWTLSLGPGQLARNRITKKLTMYSGSLYVLSLSSGHPRMHVPGGLVPPQTININN